MVAVEDFQSQSCILMCIYESSFQEIVYKLLHMLSCTRIVVKCSSLSIPSSSHLAGRSGIDDLPVPGLYCGSKASFGDIGGKGGTGGAGEVFASPRRLLEL